MDPRTCGAVCDDVAPGDPPAGNFCPIYGAPIGSLVGRVGSQVFWIGENATYTIPTDAGLKQELFLRMNDCDTGLHDNAGSIRVDVGISGQARSN